MVFLGEVDINGMVFLGVEDINCHGVSWGGGYKLRHVVHGHLLKLE